MPGRERALQTWILDCAAGDSPADSDFLSPPVKFGTEPVEYGTLSEIAHGLQMEKPVVGIGTWDIPGVVSVSSAREAVEKAFSLLSVPEV